MRKKRTGGRRRAQLGGPVEQAQAVTGGEPAARRTPAVDPEVVRRGVWRVFDASTGFARVLRSPPVQEQQQARQAAFGLKFLPPTDEAARSGSKRLWDVYEEAAELIDQERENLRKGIEALEQAIAPCQEQLAELSARAGFLDGYGIAEYCGQSAPEAVLLFGKAILQKSAGYKSGNCCYPFNLEWVPDLERVVAEIPRHKAAVRRLLQQRDDDGETHGHGQTVRTNAIHSNVPESSSEERERPCRAKTGRVLGTPRRILDALSEREPRKWETVAEKADLAHNTVMKWATRLRAAGWVEDGAGGHVRTQRGTKVLSEGQ